MPLVFSSIVPHSPITIPSIGQEGAETIAQTLAALKELEGELYVMQPDTLFVVSPHAPTADSAFSINLSPEFVADFREFGDEETKLKFSCDIELISKIQEYTNKEDKAPVNVISQRILDYGTAVSLYHLTKHVKKVKIVPISISLLGSEEHYNFGAVLRHVAMHTNKRVAFIASTELSHSVSEDSPNGYHPDGESFDHKVINMIKTNTLSDINKLNQDLVHNAQAENAYKILAMLFGSLDEVGYEARVISYESAHGVGLLVAQFSLI